MVKWSFQALRKKETNNFRLMVGVDESYSFTLSFSLVFYLHLEQ